jgi:predicted CoA-binding protein
MNPSDEELRRLLTEARTIAVVGLSDKPERDSYGIAEFLQTRGFRIVPVHPVVQEVLGERAYASLSALPPDLHVDLVDIFRRSDQVEPIVDEALARGVGGIWMQLGVANEPAAAKGRARGVPVVEDLCIRTTLQRLGIPARTPRS